MKAVKGNLFAVEIKGKVNTTNRSRDQWAQITDARSGRVLHTGQPRYIKRVAKAKYKYQPNGTNIDNIVWYVWYVLIFVG